MTEKIRTEHTPIQVTILDMETGHVRKSPPFPVGWKDGFGTYWWTEGNGSCDCNRRFVFDGPGFHDQPCQSKRYRIIAVEPLLDGFTLEDFNEYYPVPPPDLLQYTEPALNLVDGFHVSSDADLERRAEIR